MDLFCFYVGVDLSFHSWQDPGVVPGILLFMGECMVWKKFWNFHPKAFHILSIFVSLPSN
jgi:hypothetical protein